jgi:hypothetical protein
MSEVIEDVDVDEDKVTSVRKMIWMGPQRSGDVGCLFVLIGSFGSDTEHLKSVIVALSPNLLSNAAELEQIMSVPPILGVEVVGFRVVSTLDHSDHSDVARGGVPGLLMLGQSESSEGEGTVRELLMLQCPASPVAEWSMELGLLPEPRPAMEVLPGKKAVSVSTETIVLSARDGVVQLKCMRSVLSPLLTAIVSAVHEGHRPEPFCGLHVLQAAAAAAG